MKTNYENMVSNERIMRVINVVRLSGSINMLDRLSFIKIARAIDADDVADWAEQNMNAYAKLILTGKLDDEVEMD